MPQYIVKLTNRANVKQCEAALKKRKEPFNVLASINSIVLTATKPDEIINLMGDHSILRLDEDRTIRINFPNHDTQLPTPKPQPLWGMKRIGATWQRIPKGYPRPKTALLGTGISPHPHLGKRQLGVNLSGEKGMKDDHGLGTQMAGLISGYSNKNFKHKFHGVYPLLPLINVKVFNKNGESTISRLIQGIEWCLRNGVKLMVLGFTLDHHHPSLYEAIKEAYRQGVIMVAPCGDDGGLGVKYPARYYEVLAVGSTNANDQISIFSQSGTDLDLVAPGEHIYSTHHRGGFQQSSGTALACAHAAGALAISLSLKPDLTLEELRHLLQQTCEPLSTSRLLQGNGLISLRELVAAHKK